MPDFRVADTASEHPKLRAAGLAACGLWSMAGAYCMRPDVLSDGWVPEYWVAGWPSGKRIAGVLVAHSLWYKEKRGGLDGYQFHDWLGYQRAASKVEDERTKARQRMKDIRAAASTVDGKRSSDVRANKPRTSTRTPNERANEVPEKFNDSLSLSPDGSVEGVSPVGRYARDNRNPPQNPSLSRENRPPARCPKHVEIDGDPGPCRPCGDARQAAETWDAKQLRADRERRSSEARQRAEDRARAIDGCGLCDAEGYIGTQLCDHDPSAADRARRGSAAVRAALGSRPSTVDREEESA